MTIEDAWRHDVGIVVTWSLRVSKHAEVVVPFLCSRLIGLRLAICFSLNVRRQMGLVELVFDGLIFVKDLASSTSGGLCWDQHGLY